MEQLPVILGVGAAVLLAGVVAVRFSTRLGLPTLLVYLAIGVVLGEEGLGIQFDDAELTQSLGIAALVLILAEGGLGTRWSVVRPALGPGIALATVSVAISVAVVGTAMYLVLDFDWRTALLWGAVLSSTDAAAVFSVLRGKGIRKRLSGAVELESGLNDAPVYIMVILLAGTDPITWLVPLDVAYQLVFGALVGLGLGWLGAQALRRAALPATGLYPLATVAVCVFAFAAGQLAQASGLMATYIAGVVLGNSRLPHRSDTLSFAEGIGWLAQIGLFVLLGLFAAPARLLDMHTVLAGLFAGAVLLFIARPLSVVPSLLPFKIPWREQVFISWAGLRGAVPIVLASIPLAQGRPGADLLLDIVFVLVVVFTLLQGLTMTPLAKALGIAREAEPREVQVDAAPLDHLGANLLQVRIQPGSKLHGVYIAELRLPKGATVSLVVRNDTGFTPNESTRLAENDDLLIVTTESVRAAVERRIRAVDRAGRLARWKGETGR
ncbi:potassium/proton antiporter [Haloechinothrix sp. YIM 98757]|uniref:Potassium/proton antiporter n=1 Tax=Haloechinothrix aidingensis TaxID=2752311 RepID=A0A838A8Y7_9PSEU|nr:potassium/proton antiporter [Haloechinothrix aidingensis]